MLLKVLFSPLTPNEKCKCEILLVSLLLSFLYCSFFTLLCTPVSSVTVCVPLTPFNSKKIKQEEKKSKSKGINNTVRIDPVLKLMAAAFYESCFN